MILSQGDLRKVPFSFKASFTTSQHLIRPLYRPTTVWIWSCIRFKSVSRSQRFVPSSARKTHLAAKRRIEEVDSYLQSRGLYTLRTWQDEARTNEQEKAEFDRRVKNLKSRRVAVLNGQRLLEPQNESELFGLFITLCSVKPDLFPFEPLDYNTSRGIDVIARNRSTSPITDGERL